MYGHFRSWSGEPFEEETVPFFYAGASDAMGEIVAALSAEATEVARAIEARSPGTLDLSGVPPVLEWLRRSYPTQTADTSTVATCFRTGPLQARKPPMLEVEPGKLVPNFSYRYLSEDVPYGLVVTRSLAELAGVDTPTIDEVIVWAQSGMGKSYLVGGMLDGSDARTLPIPQNYGIGSLGELVDWHAQRSEEPHGRERLLP
jgi:hypothetical protein